MTDSAIAGGASTISKYPGTLPVNFPRLDPTRASGGRIHGTDGREYVDWISGLGPNLLGYGHPAVEEAVRHIKAPALSLVSDLEERVADRVRRLAGFPDGKTRFYATGSEACSAAIRVARAVTGRPLILSCGYHGWSAEALTAPPAWGVPPKLRALTRTFPFNSLELAENACFGLDCDGTGPVGRIGADDPNIHGDVIAAVFVEPATLDEPAPGFLEGLRKLCDRFGILLIYDETITLLRYPKGTAAQHYGVQPDLLVGGKGLANGRPLSALVGSADLMRCFEADWAPSPESGWCGPVYCSGTYAASADSLAAADAVLNVWAVEAVSERIRDTGRRLRNALGTGYAEAGGVRLRGTHYRLTIDTGDDWALRTFLLQELCAAGVLSNGNLMPCVAQTISDIGRTEAAWWRALRAAHELPDPIPLDAIGGRVCRPVYRQN